MYNSVSYLKIVQRIWGSFWEGLDSRPPEDTEEGTVVPLCVSHDISYWKDSDAMVATDQEPGSGDA